MARDRFFFDVLKELHDARLTGAYFITTKESSEDLFKIYIKDGELVAVTYGSAAGQDAIEILEYYRLQNGTFFKDFAMPANTMPLKFPMKKFIDMMRKSGTLIRVV